MNPISFDLQVTGVPQLWDAFNDLELAVRDKLLKRAMMRVARRIEAVAKDHTSEDTGLLKHSVSIKMITRGMRGHGVRAIIGPRRGIRMPIGFYSRGPRKGQKREAVPTRYAHLVEFGHNIVVNGVVVGYQPPHPFMRRAWDEAGGEPALYTFADTMQAGIAAEVLRGSINTTKP